MRRIWRVILPGDVSQSVEQGGGGEAAWNMALDEALLESVAENYALPTVRMYTWERPAITLGRFQNTGRTLHQDACEEHRIPIVRRITGGRGILHGDDLTLSLIAPIEALGLEESTGCSLSAIYARIAAGYLSALAHLGIDAVAGTAERARVLESRGDCFATVSRADIIATRTGSKLLGAALHRRGRWILQQASLPYRSTEESKRLRATVFVGPPGELGPDKPLAREALCGALQAGLSRALQAEFGPQNVQDGERRRAEELVSARYISPEWTRDFVRT